MKELKGAPPPLQAARGYLSQLYTVRISELMTTVQTNNNSNFIMNNKIIIYNNYNIFCRVVTACSKKSASLCQSQSPLGCRDHLSTLHAGLDLASDEELRVELTTTLTAQCETASGPIAHGLRPRETVC